MQRHPDQHCAASEQQVRAGAARSCALLQELIVPAGSTKVALHIASRYGLVLPSASICWFVVALGALSLALLVSYECACLLHLQGCADAAPQCFCEGCAADVCEPQDLLQDPLDLWQGCCLA